MALGATPSRPPLCCAAADAHGGERDRAGGILGAARALSSLFGWRADFDPFYRRRRSSRGRRLACYSWRARRGSRSDQGDQRRLVAQPRPTSDPTTRAAASVTPQGDHRIDPRRLPRRGISTQAASATVPAPPPRRRFSADLGPDAKHQAREHAPERQRAAGDADADPDRADGHSLAHDQPQHLMPRRTQRQRRPISASAGSPSRRA